MFDVIFVGVASTVTSLITASLGLGGGVTLLALLGQILPAAALIPIHGVGQFFSNIGRAYVHRSYLKWAYLRTFFLGSVVGALQRLARVLRLSTTRFASGLRQRRRRSLLAIAVTTGRTVRVSAGLPQATAKLGVLTFQQFLSLSGLGEQLLSQGLPQMESLLAWGQTNTSST